MTLRDRIHDRVERAGALAGERTARDAADRASRLATELAPGELLEAADAFRPRDGFGEWVSLTSRRLVVSDGRGEPTRSIPYAAIEAVLRRGGDVDVIMRDGRQEALLAAPHRAATLVARLARGEVEIAW